ncbi:Metacaspase-1 [Nakaseomyces bracarensis]|uniref:Metacaspase-1 n=1 Tax=Nakaseomyces bracarensis TaxID=273131 RepID=A0ABR4P154_9SACH
MFPGNGRYDYGRPAAPPPGPPPGQYPPQQQQYPQQQYPQQYGQGTDRGQFQPDDSMHRPPTQMQEGVGGQQYQYSQLTGRRKALLIGINYIGSQHALRGCINDAHNMFDFLVSRHGYSPDDIVMLTDDQREMVRVPLRQNMLRAMQWLVRDAQPNDSLFLHYSGHGGQTKDLDGDEEDGMDDVIYPVDFETVGPIIDDEMHDILVRPLPQGCRLTALFDSCHSGTVLDLPYTYSTKGVIKEPNMWKDVGSEGLQAAMAYATGNRAALFSTLGNVVSTVSKRQNVDRERVRQIKFSPADVIMFSGSKDNQTSADTFDDGQNIGAMSHAFLKVMNSQPQQSYLTLLQNMRQELAAKYSQKPQLSASHPIDVNLQFMI